MMRPARNKPEFCITSISNWPVHCTGLTRLTTKGLARIREACQKQTGRHLPDLPFPEQTKFLQEMETEHIEELNSFWRMVIDHVMQGFYGSPLHGGLSRIAGFHQTSHWF
jgi:hypothetical protein